MPTIPMSDAEVMARLMAYADMRRRLEAITSREITLDGAITAFAALNNDGGRHGDLDQTILYLTVAPGAPRTNAEIGQELGGLSAKTVQRRRSRALEHLAALIMYPDQFPGLPWKLRRVFRRNNVRELRQLTSQESEAIIGGGPWSRMRTWLFNQWLAGYKPGLTLRDLVHPDTLGYHYIRNRLYRSPSSSH